MSCILFVMVFAVLTALYEYRELIYCKEKQYAMEAQLQVYQKMLYVAKTKITKGTVLTEDQVKQEIRYTDQSIETFISQEDFGKAVTVDVAEGTCLTDDMLCSLTENVREVFVSEAELPEHLQNGDRVDIRIRYGNAEDYVVLADKVLTRGESGIGMLLELSEKEILMLSSAIVDCRRYEKVRLYAVGYPEYRQLESGVANYMANEEILIMLGEENTKGKSRIALEQRLERMEQ